MLKNMLGILYISVFYYLVFLLFLFVAKKEMNIKNKLLVALEITATFIFAASFYEFIPLFILAQILFWIFTIPVVKYILKCTLWKAVGFVLGVQIFSAVMIMLIKISPWGYLFF